MIGPSSIPTESKHGQRGNYRISFYSWVYGFTTYIYIYTAMCMCIYIYQYIYIYYMYIISQYKYIYILQIYIYCIYQKIYIYYKPNNKIGKSPTQAIWTGHVASRPKCSARDQPSWYDNEQIQHVKAPISGFIVDKAIFICLILVDAYFCLDISWYIPISPNPHSPGF